MKKNNLWIYLILDGSGSMSNVQSDVIGAVNQLIEDQKELDSGDTYFTFTVFDTKVKKFYDAAPITEVDPVDRSATLLGGGTALLDAVGKTLTDARGEKRSGKNLVFIYTDGYENSSSEWTNQGIKTLIKDLEDEGNWTFTFMSADVDNFDAAQKIGISAGNYMTTNSSTTYGAVRNLSRAAHSHKFSEAGATTSLLKDYNITPESIAVA